MDDVTFDSTAYISSVRTWDSTASAWQEVVSPDHTHNEIETRLETIEERLAIILPNDEFHKKYPALKEAYDHYKLIEKLVSGDNES